MGILSNAAPELDPNSDRFDSEAADDTKAGTALYLDKRSPQDVYAILEDMKLVETKNKAEKGTVYVIFEARATEVPNPGAGFVVPKGCKSPRELEVGEVFTVMVKLSPYFPLDRKTATVREIAQLTAGVTGKVVADFFDGGVIEQVEECFLDADEYIGGGIHVTSKPPKHGWYNFKVRAISADEAKSGGHDPVAIPE